MNQIEYYNQLIRKYFANLASEEEQEQMRGLMNDPSFLQAWEKIWKEQSYPIQPKEYPDLQRMLGDILSDPRIGKSTSSELATTERPFIFFRKWWQIAALFLATCGAVLWGYDTYRTNDVNTNVLVSARPIVPGTDK